MPTWLIARNCTTDDGNWKPLHSTPPVPAAPAEEAAFPVLLDRNPRVSWTCTPSGVASPDQSRWPHAQFPMQYVVSAVTPSRAIATDKFDIGVLRGRARADVAP